MEESRKVNIRVLGCSGSLMPDCNTTSLLINKNILIDAGSVTTLLTIEEQCNIDGVFVTHSHLDHIRDIMFLSDNICYLRKGRPLTVYGTPCIVDALKTHLFNNLIWPDFSVLPSKDDPVLKFVRIHPGEKIRLNGLDVTPILVDHIVETVGYLVEGPEGSIIFVGDTGPTQEIWKTANKADNLKAIFIETSLPDDMADIADVTGHLTPSTLELELQKLKTNGPMIYLYHMKHRYQTSIHEKIALIKNRNIHILKDGQVIRF